jgi:transcriptional regulator with XRE-family HTH domain
MTKPATRAYGRYALEAIQLLGRQIRSGRIERKMTARELAERAGISRALLHRIERGDPGSSIGAFLEAAAIVGVPLFDADRSSLAGRVQDAGARLALLPKAVRSPTTAPRDDF